MKQQHLEFFKSIEWHNSWSVLKTWDTIKSVLLKIKQILEKEAKYSQELENIIKDILTRAYMLDKIFNPLKDENDTVWDLSWSDIWWEFVKNTDNKEKNPIYYHTPSIWIFFEWKPIFLNHNYIEALWAKDEEELKKDIIEWKAIDKYYKEESQKIARNAVSELLKWNQYKNLELTTKEWNILSWNSFWNTSWLEIRIWNDITHWIFKNTTTQVNENFEWIQINTKKLILDFIIKINNIIDVGNNNKNILIVFWILSTILDKIWNEWQYLMNLTISDKEDFEMLFNNNYTTALGRPKDEIEIKAKDKTLWDETYDEETLMLIDGLINSLKNDWYYVSEFPMINKNWRSRTYSWLRFLIEDNDFWLNRTFWIWTNAVSKDVADIRKFLEW